MLWAAASLCFFFRYGELTVQTINSIDPARHLSWGGVTVDDMFSSIMSVFKTIIMWSTGQRSWSVCWSYEHIHLPSGRNSGYIVSRGTNEGPFFQLSNGNPLTKHVFVTRVRQALDALGLPKQLFAGHSFRIWSSSRSGSRHWSGTAQHFGTPKDKLARYYTEGQASSLQYSSHVSRITPVNCAATRATCQVSLQ